MRLPPTFVCLVALSLVACGTTQSASDAGGSSDGGPGDAGSACAQLNGLYFFDSNSTCSGGYSPPSFGCAMQTGCNLTLTTDGAVFTGTVTGDTISVSNADLHETCTGTIDGSGHASINCEAYEGAVTCTLNASVGTAPDGYQNVCCTVKGHECPSGSQCRPGRLPSGSYANLCYAATGNVGLNQDCTRAEGGLSKDDCAAPYVCTRNNSPAGATRCGALCTKPSDCGSGMACQRINEAVLVGTCVAACSDPFTGAGCSTGMKCSAIDSVQEGGYVEPNFLCYGVGGNGAGIACSDTSECQAGLACASVSGTCAHQCDDAHPCENSLTCSAWNLTPADDPSLGTCQ